TSVRRTDEGRCADGGFVAAARWRRQDRVASTGQLHGCRSRPVLPGAGRLDREAKEVCRGCVVREDCLEYALANGEKFGIWGGMSERERRRIRRARALARRAASAS